MRVEVSEHVGHGVEPQVVDVALPVLVHRQAQMLRGGKGEAKGANEEHDGRERQGKWDRTNIRVKTFPRQSGGTPRQTAEEVAAADTAGCQDVMCRDHVA